MFGPSLTTFGSEVQNDPRKYLSLKSFASQASGEHPAEHPHGISGPKPLLWAAFPSPISGSSHIVSIGGALMEWSRSRAEKRSSKTQRWTAPCSQLEFNSKVFCCFQSKSKGAEKKIGLQKPLFGTAVSPLPTRRLLCSFGAFLSMVSLSPSPAIRKKAHVQAMDKPHLDSPVHLNFQRLKDKTRAPSAPGGLCGLGGLGH